MRARNPDKPKGIETKAERIGSIIERLFRSRVISKEPQSICDLRTRWVEIVGEEAACRCSPSEIRAGVVWIKVESPSMFFEMRNFGSEEVLRRIQSVVPGSVTGVRFFQ